MADFEPNSADCFVFTYKEGLLSSMAHDLRLKVARFTLKITPESVQGRWDAGSLQVDTTMRDGREAPGLLGPRDLEKIARTIREDVLKSDRHPEIVFKSESVTIAGELATASTAAIRGTLTLAGRAKTIAISARRAGDRWLAEVTLHQPDFGVKPYSAMLGALKIKPDVKVLVSVPADRISASTSTAGDF